MRDIVFHLHQASKRYGEREVCFIEELEVYQGEVLGIMGPSGAGKSTLLRLLNFLEPLSSGRLAFDGYVSNGVAGAPLDLRRRMTMVFQKPVLLSSTVADNVAYGLKLRGERDVADKVQAALERVGLGGLARQKTATLSGGEAQRVALARALVIQPQVLLLDEPTANLDPYNVALIERLISEANQELGTTIVLVTHNVFQARRLAHRVMFMLDGRAVEVGPTEEVFHRPKDPRTAAFISGEMVY